MSPGGRRSRTSACRRRGRSEGWLERREGVVADLRPGGGQPRHQRGLAGVGEPDDADIGQEPKLQVDPPPLAVTALVGPAWRTVGGAGKPRVAAAAPRARRSVQPIPAAVRSPKASPRSRSETTVPSGTRSTVSVPLFPWRLAPCPCWRRARRCSAGGSESRAAWRCRPGRPRARCVLAVPPVAAVGAAARHELSPARKLTQPAPPSPPLTKMSISSMNTAG